MEAVKNHHYLHKKGGVYQVILFAEHSETKEDMVVYRRLSDNKVYVRPREMFEDGRFQPTDENGRP